MSTIRNKHRKIGRNEKCPCGSGLKYKKCHGDWVKINRCIKLIWPFNKMLMKKLIGVEQEKHKDKGKI